MGIDMERVTENQFRDALEAARRAVTDGERASAKGGAGNAADGNRFSELLADSLPGVAYLLRWRGLAPLVEPAHGARHRL